MIVVGTSGWQYDDWKPVLYEGVPKARWLEHFSAKIPAVEVNNTYYRLPSAEVFASWRARTPDGFLFAIKASRTITHLRRLRDVGEAVTVLIERASSLGPKLGPILYQCPPSLKRDDALLKAFLETLPDYPRATMEFRHASWFDDEVVATLAERDVALCVTESQHADLAASARTSWAYFRLHGGPDYTQFSETESAAWADRIQRAADSRADVLVFFDNDVAGAAVLDSAIMADRLEKVGLDVARSAPVDGAGLFG